jgi:hypothetical protein
MKNIINPRTSHFVLGIFIIAALGFLDIGKVDFTKPDQKSNSNLVIGL